MGLSGLVTEGLEIRAWKVSLQLGFVSCPDCFRKQWSRSGRTPSCAEVFPWAVGPGQSYFQTSATFAVGKGRSQLAFFLLRVSKTRVRLQLQR